MFRLAFFLCVIFSALFVSAKSTRVKEDTARIVANNFAKIYFTKISNQEFNYSKIEQNGTIQIHLFQGDHCFILIASSKHIYPVLAWSDTNPFNEETMTNEVKIWLENNTALASYYEKNKIEIPAHIAKAWTDLVHNNIETTLSFDAISPFLITTWNQGCYYNSALPEDTLAPCGHLYTGCVATAMAQVMKYYNYPKNGTGTFGYNSNYGWLEADFENTTYDWINMAINLTEENPAVAELMAHAAISVSSQFFSNGTGAYDFDARDALVDNFGYNENTQFYWRNSYAGDWTALLKEEINAGRPVIYGGVDQSNLSGHTFIMDGYQENFFHINWGWGGQYNGYYYLDTLTPAGFHFDFQHDAIIGIQPDILQPGELFGPENLSATVDQRDVTISWDPPSGNNSLELIGYNIFRNDSLINATISTYTEITDMNVTAGHHEYRVAAVFIGNGTGKSATTEAYVSSVIEQRQPDIELFPNPAVTIIHISLSKLKQMSGVNILDLNGSVVFSTRSNRDHLQVPVEDLNPGIYFISIISEDETLIRKFIKQ